MEAAIDRLRVVNAYLECTGRTAEVTPSLVRLLHCIERAETLMDRCTSDEIIAALVGELRQAMDSVTEEIGASFGTQ